jgi:hypothetical protein
MPATQTLHDGLGSALFEVDARPMCDGCGGRLHELGFTWFLNWSDIPQFICRHIAEALEKA